MDKNTNLPKHWKAIKVGEYVISVKGKKPKHISPMMTAECKIPYINIKAFEKNIIDEYTDGEGCVLCDDDDFLMVWDGSRSGYVGKAIKGALGSTLVKLKFPNVDNNYAYYFLQSKYIEINTKAKGVGIPHVDPSLLWNYDFPIPPLPEQQAIVAKIEELFSELENGKQQLLTAQQQQKVYRQSLLKAAFEGKLTNSNVKDGELPEGWKWVKLTKIGNAIDPQPSHRTPPVVTNGIPFVSIKDFDSEKDKIDFDNARRVSLEVLQEHINRYILEKGDFVIGKIGTIGKPVRITLPQNYAISANIVLIQPRQINPTFLYYYFQSNIILKAFTDGVKATTQAAFGIQKVRELLIVMPSPEEQQQIVDELESKLTVCDKIEETISNSLQQAESLRQSILKRAFEGKLVTADSINQENEGKEIAGQFPKGIEGVKTTDLHAGIIAMVIKAHENEPKHLPKLNHVKCEKIVHLVEYKLGISLGREPAKDAAGPDDYNHLNKVEHRANMANWFGSRKLAIGRTYYSKPGLSAIIDKVEKGISKEEFEKINELIQTFLPFEMEHAELIATLYAGWNNLLLQGLSPTDEEIVFESRENWSERKLTIGREKFFKTLEWMKNHDFIPQGKGKMVLRSEKAVKSSRRKN